MRFLWIVLLLILLCACHQYPGKGYEGALSVEQVLELNSNAQYFEFQDRVYITNIDWIEEVKLTKGERIGKVEKGMSNHLPIGANIYAPKERRDILIVEHNNQQKRYLVAYGE